MKRDDLSIRLRLSLGLLLLLFTGACNWITAPTPKPEAVSTATASATPIPTQASTTPSPTAAGDVPTPTASLPSPALFEGEWDDLDPFRAALIPSQQGVLEEARGSSVYHLEIRIDGGLDQVEGQLEVLYTNREEVDLSEVLFRLYPNLIGDELLQIESARVNGQDVDFEIRSLDSVLSLPLSPPLQPGERRVLGLDFTLSVPDSDSLNYGIFGFNEGIMDLAYAYPIIPVYDDEGWNAELPSPYGDLTYADSSFYLVRVMAPETVTLVSSGVEIERASEGDTQQVTYALAPARDFYLAVSPRFTRVTREWKGVMVNSYAFSEFTASAEFALDRAVNALEIYEERIGPYPYTEFDVVSTSMSALGIEYPGMTAISLDLYDSEEGGGSPAFEATVAHEVGHQWFYNVVGNDQVDDPWLDEALVQYITLLYYGETYGPEGADAFQESLEARWERVNRADIPIGLPVEAYEGREYGAIVYGRGPLFFVEMAESMGQEAFDAFLRDYYERYSWGIATPEGLKSLAEAHCGCDLTDLFEAWVYP